MMVRSTSSIVCCLDVLHARREVCDHVAESSFVSLLASGVLWFDRHVCFGVNMGVDLCACNAEGRNVFIYEINAFSGCVFARGRLVLLYIMATRYLLIESACFT